MNDSQSTLKLRPYQERAIVEARRQMANTSSVLINAPTGAGKTVIGCQIIRSAVQKGRRVLFLAHRRELIDQCSAKLDEAGVLHHGVILANHPKSRAPHAPVQVASIQTLIRREFPPADLIIIDEAHRALANSYQNIIGNYKHAKIIGLTATPERLDGRGLKDVFSSMVVVATIPELITEGYLIAPTCYGAPNGGPDLSRVKKQRGDYNEGQLQEAMDTTRLVGELLENWQQRASTLKTVIFATGIEHSQHIVEQFKKVGVSIAHLDGTTPVAVREQIIRDWKIGRIQVVSNCSVLTEGFDFPELECCVLARPTQSVSLYLQMVGRVMRPAPGKEGALVLDHARALHTHGMPNEHREWLLDGEARKRDGDVRTVSQCQYCFMAHSEPESLWLQPIQPNAKTEAVQKAIKMALAEQAGVGVCPGCSKAECCVCHKVFEAGGATPVCLNCGSSYEPKPAESSTDREPRELPTESADRLVLWTSSPANERLSIKNEFALLMREAHEKGYKRGWAFHKLCDRYGEGAVKSALPFHRAEWWRVPA